MSQEPIGLMKDIIWNYIRGCDRQTRYWIQPFQVDTNNALIDVMRQRVAQVGLPSMRDMDVHQSEFIFLKVLEHPGMQYITTGESPNVLPIVMNALLQCWPLLAFAMISAVFAGVVIWALDSRRNREEFPQSFIKGTWEGFWWSFISMTTVGYGDKTPKSFIGRVFSIWWILFGVIVMALFVANITSVLTSLSLNSDKEDIIGEEVAVLGNDTDYVIAKENGAEPKIYDTVEDMVRAVKAGKVRGMLLDSYATAYYKKLNKLPSTLFVALSLDVSKDIGVIFAEDLKPLVGCLTLLRTSISQTAQDLTNQYKVTVQNVRHDIQLFSVTSVVTKHILLWSLGALAVTLLAGALWDVINKWRRRKEESRDIEVAENSGMTVDSDPPSAEMEEGQQLLIQLKDYIAKLQRKTQGKPHQYVWKSFDSIKLSSRQASQQQDASFKERE